MLEHLFVSLSKALEQPSAIALSASFIWGVLSIILSPCHLASIPLIIGFLIGQKNITRFQALLLSTSFAVGILITIAIIGFITSQMGRLLGDLGGYANYLVAIVFFVFGLNLMDILPLPFSGLNNINLKQRGLIAAFILGLIFGIALGPCTFGFMAPVLMISFKMAKTNLFYAVLLITVFGLGHCFVIAVSGVSAKAVQKYLDWNEKSKGGVILRRVCGILVLLGGIYLVYTAK